MKNLFFLFITFSCFPNDTELLNALLKQSNSILLENRIYEIETNKILLQNRNIEIIGHDKGTTIRLIESVEYNSRKPKSLLIFKNCTNVCITNINFEGINNSVYALTFFKDEDLVNEHYLIEGNQANEIGLVYFRPEEGFTFNFYELPFQDWFLNGYVKCNQLFSNIKILNNKVFGNDNFKVNSFKGPSVSAISIHFSRNVIVENNYISNYRFGIWIYGGGSRTPDKSQLTYNNIICENITVINNKVEQTYSPIWFSKTRNIVAQNNLCVSNQDVALDFEGCSDALIIGNKVTNSKGGALVALNGSKNIFFHYNEIIVTEKYSTSKFNISLVRDANSNIHYTKNSFINKTTFHSRILIKNSSRDIVSNNEDIIFKENLFLNVIIEARDNQLFSVESNYQIKQNEFLNFKASDIKEN